MKKEKKKKMMMTTAAHAAFASIPTAFKLYLA